MRKLTPKEAFLICGGQSTNSTLTLDSLTIIATEFDPVTLPEGTMPDEGGGGQSGPVENPYCIAPARAVDASFLSANEGGQRLRAYVPDGDQSGITVGTGVDLAGRTQQSMTSLGWPQSLITQLLPYTTQRGQAARDYISANPLVISAENATLMDTSVFNDIVDDIARRFDAAASFADFDQLPPGTQTVIADMAYQYGPNLRGETPNFWQQITTGDWQAALANLLDFHDEYGPRRRLEAALLEEDLNQFRLPTPNDPC